MSDTYTQEAAAYVQDKDEVFRYQLLSRMYSDCRYYLGNGRLYGPHLWAGDEERQIAYMKALWHSFPVDGKPQWLSLDDIIAYEKRLCPRYKIQQDALNHIAGKLCIVAWYPACHADPGQMNPVLLYVAEDYADNQKIGARVQPFHPFYHSPDSKQFHNPFLTLKNTDANGAMSYDFACDGHVDLRSEDWENRLFSHIQCALKTHLTCRQKTATTVSVYPA